MLSAFYICCIHVYSSALQTRFLMEVNNISPDQSLTWRLGPYCLQYKLPKKVNRQEEQTTKVVTSKLRVHLPCLGTQSPRGTWPFNESGTPITAASAMYGLSMIAFKNVKQNLSQWIVFTLLLLIPVELLYWIIYAKFEPWHETGICAVWSEPLLVAWIFYEC